MAKVQPLSSSPEPLKVKFEPIPIGFPVVASCMLDHVMSTPPVTVRSPALADEIVAREPQSADKPTLVNLFIIYFCLSLRVKTLTIQKELSYLCLLSPLYYI